MLVTKSAIRTTLKRIDGLLSNSSLLTIGTKRKLKESRFMWTYEVKLEAGRVVVN